ncbi:MAG: endonuclease/exonuclease/phosphatase family protein [Shewanella sp.]|nr:endonuclease/exonuclease/phosphatase family protein [Shewanella sp.]MCF1431846.1 endonuclease/exonuclease/phosphatase family protein [Shewanella sp.]MCF1439266.1 endonuclease/exonuclease/phosphatase family protein [Shewanella sp.]MCF1456179.1 endonuclease/exonuclease/phosphatase family protein [Shewanella sp.]
MASADTSTDVLRFATINLLNFIEPPLACYESDNIYFHAQWQSKCDWLTCYIQRQQPDVIAFQEVFSPAALIQLLAPMGFSLVAVEEPGLAEGYIYNRPINMIASRFPVLEQGEVTVEPQVCQAMGLEIGFSFSRRPVWCRVQLPLIGQCDLYAVHLKSKRPSLDLGSIGAITVPDAVQTMSRQLGRASADLLRGAEAAMLMYSIIARRSQDRLPIALMGDFNDGLGSTVLDVLHIDNQIDAWLAASPDRREAGVDFYGLRDSFHLHCLHVGAIDRTPTHYWGGHGNVLDYILLSCEFDPRSSMSTMDVTDFRVCDRHLFGPESLHERESSDHAPVLVELAPRY